MKKVLILLTLVALAVAAPQVPQVYAFDYFNHEENRAQFLRRNGEAYSWGYEFPERVHLESRDETGQIEGSYGFVNADGTPVLVQYQANPESGFTSDIQQVQSAQAFPASRAQSAPVEVEAPSVPEVEVAPYSAPIVEVVEVIPVVEVEPPSVPEVEVSPYSALVKELPYIGNLAAPAPLLAMVEQSPPNLTPLLKAAVQTGRITQFEILEDGSSTFAVSPDAIEEAGTVSNLAVQLGASLPAARHDVRSPYQASEEPIPTLDFHNNLFVLRVPPADPSVGPLVVDI